MRTKCIFIVDDSATNCLLLEDILIDEGYRVFTYCSPVLALTEINIHYPDLILLDLNMPGINGFQFYEKIQDHRIPVIIVSATVDPKTIDLALELGIKDYITKPIKIQNVKDKVNQLFAENTI